MTKLVNRAKMTTATTGTGTITLGSAVDGYQTFADAGVADADVVRYVIEDGDAWEIGLGTYTASGTTLTRGSIESSNADNPINLSGTALVFLTVAGGDLQHAADMNQGVATTDSPTFAGLTATTADINGGTIDGTTIGGSTPAAGTFSSVTVNGNITVTGTVDGRDVAADGSKLDGIEAGADVTDTANVTAAGALMASEITNLAAVKAFDPTDYTQPGDNISTLTNDAGYTTNIGDITGVTAGSGLTGGGTSGSVTVSHADTSTQASVNNTGATFIQDVTLDTYGHVTGLGSATLGLSDFGVTATATELNVLDGITATTTELNKLDGFAGTTDNLNATQFLTGRNAIINGNFDIWQRGTSFSAPVYGADRWINARNGTAATQSRQAFTLGQTAVPNEPTYFCRTVVTSVAGSGNYSTLRQPVESVRTFAGQTVTLSFWAKANASKKIAVEFTQGFGFGGSPSAEVTSIGVTTCSLTTSWQKFTVTASIPSISGKTLGTGGDRLELNFWFDAGSNFNSRTNSLGQQSGTFDIAQVQLEAGDVATPFEMRPIGQELALCQRYYEKTYNQGVSPGSASNFVGVYSFSKPVSTFAAVMPLRFSVPKRVSPSVTIFNPETGSAGSYLDFASLINETSFSLFDIGEAGLKFFVGVGRPVDGAFHYTADAEL